MRRSGTGQMDQRHGASEFTKAATAKLLEELPFEDQRDFEEATRGMIAPLSTEAVVTEAGTPVWAPKGFAFIEDSPGDPRWSPPNKRPTATSPAPNSKPTARPGSTSAARPGPSAKCPSRASCAAR